MNDGLVSIVIPTYNRANVIQRAVKSALQQNYEDIEIIVIDDGSKDDTKQRVKELSSGKLRYIFQENIGANAARNRGIKEANGEFISFLDSDDELLPNYVSRTVTAFRNSDNQCGGIFTSYKRVNRGKMVEEISSPNSTITLDDLRATNIIGGLSCTTFRSSVLDSVRGFDEELVSSQDYDLYLRVLHTYTMRGISEPLVKVHLGDDRISENIDRKVRGHKQIVDRHGQILSRKRIAHQHYVRGLLYGEKGDMKQARIEFKAAVIANKKYPLYALHYVLSLFGRYLYSQAMSLKHRIRRFI